MTLSRLGDSTARQSRQGTLTVPTTAGCSGVLKRQYRRFPALESIHPNAAGIDIGSQTHWVCVPAERDSNSIRSFGCFTADLHALADWLAACGVETVAMESTGVYWIPLFQILATRGFEVQLVNAQHVKTLPDRKCAYARCSHPRWFTYHPRQETALNLEPLVDSK